jgi:hypothetical protein
MNQATREQLNLMIRTNKCFLHNEKYLYFHCSDCPLKKSKTINMEDYCGEMQQMPVKEVYKKHTDEIELGKIWTAEELSNIKFAPVHFAELATRCLEELEGKKQKPSILDVFAERGFHKNEKGYWEKNWNGSYEKHFKEIEAEENKKGENNV